MYYTILSFITMIFMFVGIVTNLPNVLIASFYLLMFSIVVALVSSPRAQNNKL